MLIVVEDVVMVVVVVRGGALDGACSIAINIANGIVVNI